jgi:hypothetical protein
MYPGQKKNTFKQKVHRVCSEQFSGKQMRALEEMDNPGRLLPQQSCLAIKYEKAVLVHLKQYNDFLIT